MKVLPRHIEALSLCADAANGGDPWMTHVTYETIRDLLVARLIRQHTPEEAAVLKRHHVPTDEGYAALSKAYAPKQRARATQRKLRGAA